MRFATDKQAFEALADPATHDAAARVLLAHAERFDYHASWSFARPMMRCVIAMRRDFVDDRRNIAGPETYEALKQLEDFLIDAVFCQSHTPWGFEWNPDIDVAAE